MGVESDNLSYSRWKGPFVVWFGPSEQFWPDVGHCSREIGSFVEAAQELGDLTSYGDTLGHGYVKDGGGSKVMSLEGDNLLRGEDVELLKAIKKAGWIEGLVIPILGRLRESD